MIINTVIILKHCRVKHCVYGLKMSIMRGGGRGVFSETRISPFSFLGDWEMSNIINWNEVDWWDQDSAVSWDREFNHQELGKGHFTGTWGLHFSLVTGKKSLCTVGPSLSSRTCSVQAVCSLCRYWGFLFGDIASMLAWSARGPGFNPGLGQFGTVTVALEIGIQCTCTWLEIGPSTGLCEGKIW